MTYRRPLLAIVAGALLALPFAATTLAQSPSPAASAMASVPAGPAIAVVATEYHFAGIPTSVPVGTTFSLQNEGKEVHELAIFRKNDGVTQSIDELLQMPGDEASQYVTQVGQIFAGPGQAADGLVNVTQPGEYVALCFIPRGLTYIPDPSASLDPALASATPHYMLGMVQAFTVTDAGTPVGPLPSEMPMGSPGASSAP